MSRAGSRATRVTVARDPGPVARDRGRITSNPDPKLDPGLNLEQTSGPE